MPSTFLSLSEPICFLQTVAACSYWSSGIALGYLLKKPLMLHILGLKLPSINVYFWITSLCIRHVHQFYALSLTLPSKWQWIIANFLSIFIYFAVFHCHFRAISRRQNRMTSGFRTHHFIEISTITANGLSADVTGPGFDREQVIGFSSHHT